MAEVDTSFYKDAVSDSPLKVAGEVADYRNKLLSNVQNEQAVQANNIKLATERFGMINNAASGLLSVIPSSARRTSPRSCGTRLAA
jgi:hypothetical protein